MIERLKEEIKKWEYKYDMHRGMSFDLDVMHENVLRNLRDALATELLEQAVWEDEDVEG